MQTLDKQYTDLLQDILDNGVVKSNRTGTNTLSVFGRQIRHKMSDGFPLLTTKKVAFKQIVSELIWFLRGETNIQQLVKLGNNIWVGDAYKNYVIRVNMQPGVKMIDPMTKDEFIEKIKYNNAFADKWGELGKIYGAQWRNWKSTKTKYIQAMSGPGMEVNETIDQIQVLIDTLNTNPDDRRMIVSAWNVGELPDMVLPPCHYGFQVYTRKLRIGERYVIYEKEYMKTHDTNLGLNHDHIEHDVEANTPERAISLMVNIRSSDVGLGLPFNIASYGLLLEIFGKEVNMIPDDLILNLGDTHIYMDHIDGVTEQIKRTGLELPSILWKTHLTEFDSIIDIIRPQDIILDNYKSHPKITFPLSN